MHKTMAAESPVAGFYVQEIRSVHSVFHAERTIIRPTGSPPVLKSDGIAAALQRSRRAFSDSPPWQREQPKQLVVRETQLAWPFGAGEDGVEQLALLL